MRLRILLICVIATLNILSAKEFADETVSYKVMYKWGLLSKQAGRATITLRNEGDYYHSQLTARTEPWADRFFLVRDTLNARILRDGFLPQFYEKIAHEGKDHKHDTVTYEYTSDSIIGHCTRVVYEEDKLDVDKKQRLASTGVTVDMLSSFYYMRSLPYHEWQSGHDHTITIFSGKRKENLTLEYKGIETVEIDGHKYICYHITFIFTGNGGEKTSDDMDAWITTNDKRTAVRLEGKLPVGKVRCQIM